MLGEALSRQKKYADAEKYLLEGYEGLRERAGRIPPINRNALSNAAESLARHYDATGDVAKAEKWRNVAKKPNP